MNHNDFTETRLNMVAVEHDLRRTRGYQLQPEIDGMLKAVNTERAAMGKPGVAREAVVSADMQAMGHSDYARKFALYCAELVHDVSV